MKIGLIFENIINEGDGLEFIDNHRDHAKGQDYHDITLKLNDEIVAHADYSVYNDVVQIDNIESIMKGKGYGQMIMKFLADKYGYENLERASLTPDGVKMRQKLDKHFDYAKHIESKNKHLNPNVIENIKNPIIKGFVMDMVKYGYKDTWNKYLTNPKFKDLAKELEANYNIDFNDVATISEWVKGSVTNNNLPEDDVPHIVLKELSILFKIK